MSIMFSHSLRRQLPIPLFVALILTTAVLLSWNAILPPKQPAKSNDQQTADAIQPDNSFGVYLTANSVERSDFFIQTLDNLKKINASAVVIDVKEGDVYFQTDAAIANEIGSVHARFHLAEITLKAKERGLKVIARFVATKDPLLAAAKPETQIMHAVTGRSVGEKWVDPAQETTLLYNRELLEEIVRMGVDEINIDYIRYPSDYHPDQIGLTTDEKAQHLLTFLRMAREVIDAAGSETKLGISTYAILGWEYEKNNARIAQDVVLFEPLVDVISPMAYPASFAPGAYYTGETKRSRMYELVYKTLLGYKELLGDQSWKLRPWIQGYRVTVEELRDEIDAVFDAGICGFTVWSPGNNYWPLYGQKEPVRAPGRCLQ